MGQTPRYPNPKHALLIARIPGAIPVAFAIPVRGLASPRGVWHSRCPALTLHVDGALLGRAHVALLLRHDDVLDVLHGQVLAEGVVQQPLQLVHRQLLHVTLRAPGERGDPMAGAQRALRCPSTLGCGVLGGSPRNCLERPGVLVTPSRARGTQWVLASNVTRLWQGQRSSEGCTLTLTLTPVWTLTPILM